LVSFNLIEEPIPIWLGCFNTGLTNYAFLLIERIKAMIKVIFGIIRPNTLDTHQIGFYPEKN
jgi:hypothetical protein